MRSRKIKVERTSRNKWDDYADELKEWERTAVINLPLVVSTLSYEQWRVWIRGVYSDGKPFNWM